MDYELHELAMVFPELPWDEYAALVASIAAYGLRQPIAVWRGQIIDGRHRAAACDEAGVDARYEFLADDADPFDYVMDANIRRRHLDAGQRAMLGVKLSDMRAHGSNRHQVKSHHDDDSRINTALTPPPEPPKSRSEVAETAGVSTATIDRAKQVKAAAPPEVVDAVIAGAVPLAEVAKAVKIDPSPESLVDALDAVKAGDRKRYSGIVQINRNAALAEVAPPLPAGQYRTLVIDPPWPMERIAMPHDIEPPPGFEYPTMSVDGIKALPVSDLYTDEGAFVFLWTTQIFLPAALDCLKAWGAPYRFTMTWFKATKSGGMGEDLYHPVGTQLMGRPCYNTEFVVVGSTGKVRFVDTHDFQTGFIAPRAGPSVKPERFYDILRRVAPEPRVDMFGRRDIDGFERWGNE